MQQVVELHGTEAAVAKIGVPLAEGGARRPWFFNDTATPLAAIASTPTAWGATLHAHAVGAQMGGFTTSYEAATATGSGGGGGGTTATYLSFVTFKGSGHMVSAYAPQRALHVLHRLLLDRAAGQPPMQLAPPLPRGWDSASDAEFYARSGSGTPGLFAQWVAKATGAPYV